MRKIVKNFTAPPAKLTSPRCMTQMLNIYNSRIGKDATYYNKDTVVEALNKLYHSKCGYCEGQIDIVASENVEHYRPKGTVNSLDLPAGATHPGYYWLSNEWSNLLISCPKCNQPGHKGTRFPIHRHNRRISSPPALSAAGQVVLASNSHLLPPISREDPLIINPEFKDPGEHLKVIDSGELKPVHRSIYGAKTIEVCGLNRPPLIAARKKIIDRIVVQIEKRIESFTADVEPLTEGQFRRELNTVFDEITDRLDDKSTFTLVARMIIKNFDTLVLSKIDPIFHPIIRNHFDRYIDN
jgi:hypothetical protein